jgi:integral membrane protein
VTSPADPATSATPRPPITPAIRGALTRYRVIAYVVGVMLLLLLFVAMPLKYLGDEPALSDKLGMLHGMLLYPAYVVVSFVVGYQARWSLTRTVLVILAGTVPFMSFVAERSVLRQVRSAQQPQPAAPGQPA